MQKHPEESKQDAKGLGFGELVTSLEFLGLNGRIARGIPRRGLNYLQQIIRTALTYVTFGGSFSGVGRSHPPQPVTH